MPTKESPAPRSRIQAFDLLLEAGEEEEALELACESGDWPATAVGAVEMVERALELSQEGSLTEARLRHALADALHSERQDVAGARELLVEALAIAERQDDTRLQVQCLASRWEIEAQTDPARGRTGEYRSYLERALQLAESLGDLRLLAFTHVPMQRAAVEIIMGIFESAAYGKRIDLPQANRDHPLPRWRAEAGLGEPDEMPMPDAEWLQEEERRLG